MQTTPEFSPRSPTSMPLRFRLMIVLLGLFGGACPVNAQQAQWASPIETASTDPNVPPSQPSASPMIRRVAAFLPAQETTEAPSSSNENASGETVQRPAVLEGPLNTLPAVAKAISDINADPALDEMLKARIVETLNGIQTKLKERQTSADRLAAVEKELSRMIATKEIAKKEAAATITVPTISGNFKPIERISEQRTAASNELAAAQEELQRIEDEINGRKERIEALPTEIAEARKQLETLKKASVGEVNDDPGGVLQALMKRAQGIAVEAAEQRVKTLVAEQTLFEAQTDLLPLKKTAQDKKVAVAEAVFRAWSTELSKKRQSQIDKDLKQFKKELADAGIDPAKSLILRLEERWIQTVGETERIDQRLASEKAESTQMTEELRTQAEQIERTISETGGLPSSLGLKLQLLKRRLPSPSSLRSDIDEVNESIERSRQLQTELELIVEGQRAEVGASMPVGEMSAMAGVSTPISKTEEELLLKFRTDLAQHQNRLLELQTELETQKTAVTELVQLIDTNVVWIKNQPTFKWSDVKLGWEALRWILKPSNLVLVSTQIAAGLIARLELLIILVACVLAMVFAGQRLRRRITTHGLHARDRSSVSLRPTFAATLISWALVLPLVTVLYLLGEALRAGGLRQPLIVATASALHLAAIAVLPIELLRQCLRANGLAVAHFDADDESLVGTRRWLRMLIDIGLPLLICYGIADALGRSPSAVALSRLALVSGMVLISVFFWRAFEPKQGIFSQRIRANPDSWLARLRHVWYLPVVAVPLVLAVVALMGYAGGAQVLIERLYWTLWLCLIAYYVGGLVHRWLLTQRRRLTLAVHRERLEESQRISVGSGVGGVGVEPSTTMAASEINAQTTRLIQTFLFIAALIGVSWIWSPVLPAVKYLEGVTLWESVDDKNNRVPITLANLLMTLPVLVLTVASVRNLPGLVEGVLLERLPLDKPARYAITTLGTYALAIVGLLISLQTLGLRWDNIQWLVAALGVGLGFGLQEIFANFISGLILLFEQPIRIGDVVTLGDTTGVVARIRMRATTVTNWDRQELIIPNKDLITGRLVNWTLSDSTNRIVINVGIAYGSDTEAACELLREICHDHPAIAEDPAPVVTFEGFGDSTLNLVVRSYLATLDDRLLTIHQLHTIINQRFMAANIEIAFPQRDLHLRSLPPELMNRLAPSKMAG